MSLTALCLDPSLTGTGFALMPVPLTKDGNGYNSLNLIVRGNIAGVIENKDSKEPEQVRVRRLYDELWGALHLAKLKGPVDLIAAEMAPHMYAGREQDRSNRFQFASYTVIRLFASIVGVPLLECNPEHSKRAVGAAPRADKKEIKRTLAFRCLGDAGAKWPLGWTEDVLDALTVGFWLDSLYQSQRMGETTALAPFMPAELVAPV